MSQCIWRYNFTVYRYRDWWSINRKFFHELQVLFIKVCSVENFKLLCQSELANCSAFEAPFQVSFMQMCSILKIIWRLWIISAFGRVLEINAAILFLLSFAKSFNFAPKKPLSVVQPKYVEHLLAIHPKSYNTSTSKSRNFAKVREIIFVWESINWWLLVVAA